MPRLLEVADDRAITLEECAEGLAAAGFEPRDEGSLIEAAGWLRRLGNHRTFLGDILLGELKSRHHEAPVRSSYGPQVLLVTPVRNQCFLRANVWPAEDDPMLRASGAAAFAYGLAHDHNFDFLTLGYFGPGYWSDYYEYDYAEVCGYAGEAVPSLRFVGRERLAENRLLHYRAHRDVHSQIAPDSLSVSLNVMHCCGAQSWFDQYAFDLEQRRIARIVNGTSSEAFLRIAVAAGGAEALDLAHCFAGRHPSERMRLCAFEALAAAAPDPRARDRLWRRAEISGSRLVAREARMRRAALAR